MFGQPVEVSASDVEQVDPMPWREESSSDPGFPKYSYTKGKRNKYIRSKYI